MPNRCPNAFRKMKCLNSPRKGVSIVEYGLLGLLVTLACLTAMQFLGTSIVKLINDSSAMLSAAIGG